MFMTRRDSLLLSIGAAFSTNVMNSHAQSEAVLNGLWWIEQSTCVKMGYITGFVAIASKSRAITPELVKLSGLKENESLRKMIEANFDFRNIAYGSFLEGLDKFFSDYRNKQINIEDAMSYVRDDISGRELEKLEENLRQLRRYAATEK